MTTITCPVAPLAAGIRAALATIAAQPTESTAAQAADAASITQLATDFVVLHASEIAAAERAHRQEPGSLLGACYIAAHAALAAGSRLDVGRMISRAVYSVVGSLSEPVSRPHRGHSYAVPIEQAATGVVDGLDPLAEIVMWETVHELERENAYCRQALREAAENDNTPASNYRGREVAERTAERRRAQARTAQEFGQQEFCGFGWNEGVLA